MKDIIEVRLRSLEKWLILKRNAVQPQVKDLGVQLRLY